MGLLVIFTIFIGKSINYLHRTSRSTRTLQLRHIYITFSNVFDNKMHRFKSVKHFLGNIEQKEKIEITIRFWINVSTISISITFLGQKSIPNLLADH